MTLHQYGALRVYLPVPTALFVPWLILTIFPTLGPSQQEGDFRVLVSVIGILIVTIEGWKLPRRILNRIGIQCPTCQEARACIPPSNGRLWDDYHCKRCGKIALPPSFYYTGGGD